MQSVTELRGELAALTRERAHAIEQINREFDRKATELTRLIEELEPPDCPHCGYKYGHRLDCMAHTTAPARPQRARRQRTKSVSLGGTEDWTPEEIAHYKALQGR